MAASVASTSGSGRLTVVTETEAVCAAGSGRCAAVGNEVSPKPSSWLSNSISPVTWARGWATGSVRRM